MKRIGQGSPQTRGITERAKKSSDLHWLFSRPAVRPTLRIEQMRDAGESPRSLFRLTERGSAGVVRPDVLLVRRQPHRRRSCEGRNWNVSESDARRSSASRCSPETRRRDVSGKSGKGEIARQEDQNGGKDDVFPRTKTKTCEPSDSATSGGPCRSSERKPHLEKVRGTCPLPCRSRRSVSRKPSDLASDGWPAATFAAFPSLPLQSYVRSTRAGPPALTHFPLNNLRLRLSDRAVVYSIWPSH